MDHDPRCISLTDGEFNHLCDCRTLAAIDRAERVLAAHARRTGIRDHRDHCVCGWAGDWGTYRRHVAEMLAAGPTGEPAPRR